MNFDNIKSALDSDSEGFNVPSTLDQIKGSNLPIDKIRKTMKSEIISQLAIIVIFYAALFAAKLSPLAFSVYLIFITITCIFTMMYLVKLMGFRKRTSNLALNTKSSIHAIIYDIKLTLEVYKTAIIAGSILLPIPAAAFLMGTEKLGNPALFEKLFLFQGTTLQTAMVVVCFLALAIFFYYLTIWWADKMYGKEIKELEEVLEQLGE